MRVHEQGLRIDVRPPFWQRLREVFWRGAPRPLRIGFVFAPLGPDGPSELQRVDVTVMAPCGVREVDLCYEIIVSDGWSLAIDSVPAGT